LARHSSALDIQFYSENLTDKHHISVISSRLAERNCVLIIRESATSLIHIVIVVILAG